MPSGIYQRAPMTDEQKRKLSIAHKGKPNSGHFKKGMKHSDEDKLRMSLTRRGSDNANWKGGTAKHKDGYVFIYLPGHPRRDRRNYVLEHRVVVERIIGRVLDTKEKVHHLGKRDDNRPNMLMAFINQAAHNRFERDCEVNPKEIIYDGRKYDRKNHAESE